MGSEVGKSCVCRWEWTTQQGKACIYTWKATSLKSSAIWSVSRGRLHRHELPGTEAAGRFIRLSHHPTGRLCLWPPGRRQCVRTAAYLINRLNLHYLGLSASISWTLETWNSLSMKGGKLLDCLFPFLKICTGMRIDICVYTSVCVCVCLWVYKDSYKDSFDLSGIWGLAYSSRWPGPTLHYTAAPLRWREPFEWWMRAGKQKNITAGGNQRIASILCMMDGIRIILQASPHVHTYVCFPLHTTSNIYSDQSLRYPAVLWEWLACPLPANPFYLHQHPNVKS